MLYRLVGFLFMKGQWTYGNTNAMDYPFPHNESLFKTSKSYQISCLRSGNGPFIFMKSFLSKTLKFYVKT